MIRTSQQSSSTPVPKQWSESDLKKKVALSLLASVVIAAVVCTLMGAIGTFAHRGISYHDLFDQMKSHPLKTSFIALAVLGAPLLGWGARVFKYHGKRGLYFDSTTEAALFVFAKLGGQDNAPKGDPRAVYLRLQIRDSQSELFPFKKYTFAFCKRWDWDKGRVQAEVWFLKDFCGNLTAQLEAGSTLRRGSLTQVMQHEDYTEEKGPEILSMDFITKPSSSPKVEEGEVVQSPATQDKASAS